MNVIVDAYGGDHAPLAVLEGAALAVAEYGITVTLVGRQVELKELATQKGVSLAGMEFIEAETAMPVEADPTELTRKYKESSLAMALAALADGQGDAVVSAGSTGAITVGATLMIKRIKGIKRPAIGVVLPDAKGLHMLIDSGANSECRPEMLLQFGIMGSVYMKAILGIEKPRVGMVNIGTEPNKGLELQQEASALLAKAPVNFIGNIEASQLPMGGCDVAVTDGFTGNIILKHTEGMAKMFGAQLKTLLLKNGATKVAALLLKKGIGEMSKLLDPSEYGGVPLLGVTKPVIKAHGSSNALAIKNAIGQGKKVAEEGMIAQIEQELAAIGERPREL